MADICEDANCEYDQPHPHGIQCTSTCGVCYPDKPSLPTEPERVIWTPTPICRVGYTPENGQIRIFIHGHPIDLEEFQTIGPAVESAQIYKSRIEQDRPAEWTENPPF